jgi:hypothetical protein
MKRKFYYHPDRRKEVGDAVMVGHLVVPSAEYLVEDALMPLKGSTGYQILGFWVDCMEPEDFFVRETPESRWPICEYHRALVGWGPTFAGI